MTIDWGSGWGWGMGLWMLGGLALTIGVVVLIVWAVVSVGRRANDGGRGPQQPPLTSSASAMRGERSVRTSSSRPSGSWVTDEPRISAGPPSPE